MTVLAVSGGVGGLAELAAVFVGLVLVIVGLGSRLRRREGRGPFGSRWRASSWAYALFVLGFVVVAASGSSSRHPFLYGAVFWAVTVGVVFYRWIETRTQSRPCLRCGVRVPIGVLDCAACGFDFRSIWRPRSETDEALAKSRAAE